MKVYWTQDEADKKHLPGRKQNIDLQFEYMESHRCIPFVYRFPEGIVFDVLTIIDEAKMRAFYEKYADAEENLSPVQQRAAEGEHPYQSVTFEQLSVNGKRIDGWSSTTLYHIPWMGEESVRPEELKAYRKYLNGAACFVCERCYVRLNTKAISLRDRLMYWLNPKRIDRLEFKTAQSNRFLPIELTYDLPLKLSGVQTENFVHPKTLENYTLYFQDIKQEQIKMPMGNEKRLFRFAQVSYEIDRELPDGDQLQFNANLTVQQPLAQDDGVHYPDSAASIGIIGGSDGPTAIFFGQKHDAVVPGINGLPLHFCTAPLPIGDVEKAQVLLEGINVKCADSKIIIYEYGK